GAAQGTMRAGAVGDHRRRQGLGQLAGVRDPEQVHLRRVGPPACGARERRLADARLAGTPGASKDQVRARLQPCGDLPKVVPAPDQLSGRDRRISGEQLAARLSHAAPSLHSFCVKIHMDCVKIGPGSLLDMANRLADETSPYLLQHKDNPVDWYPWGDEALARARRSEERRVGKGGGSR